MDLTALAALLSVPAAVVASLAPWVIRRSRLAKLENLAKLLALTSGSREYRDALTALQARLAEDALVAHVTSWRWGRVFVATYLLLGSTFLIFQATSLLPEKLVADVPAPIRTAYIVFVYASGAFFLFAGASAARHEIRFRGDRQRLTRRLWQERKKRGRNADTLATVVSSTDGELKAFAKAAAEARRERRKSKAESRKVDSNHRPSD